VERDKAYIKLGRRLKTPVEKWRDPNNQYTYAELAGWDGNIGRISGYNNIVVLDIDDPNTVDALGIKLFETYAVKTGSGGYHLYYRIPDAKKVIIHGLDKKHLGELQCMGQYVVSPGSVHPNGSYYQHINPGVEILDITQEEVLSPFRGLCKLSDELVKPKVQWVPTGTTDDPFAKVSVEDVWNAKVTEVRGDQLFCVHPNHGSDTGHNLVIHPGKNVWKCWRCHSGGSAAMAIAVRYGIIDCSDARPGALRGDKFKEVIRIAEEKGIIKGPDRLYTYAKKELEFDD
jgi:hypothetical protein